MEHLIKYNKSNTFSTQNVNTIERMHNQIPSNAYIKQYSIVTDFKINDKQYNSKLTVERKEPIQNTINSRYQLNVQNYITELHNNLIKECKDHLLDSSSLNAKLDFDSLNNITNRTLNAIKNQKVFTILGYFPKISEAMKNRGWVEKRDPYRPPINYSKYLKSAPYMINWIESPPVLLSSTSENEAIWERLKNMQSWSILKDKRSDFIFVTRKRLVNWANLNASTTVSQIARHAFCTKNGLAQSLLRFKNATSMFPRCHYIRNEKDYNAFMEDYILTALIGTLKIIVQAIEKNKKIFSKNGNIPYDLINFVKQRTWRFLKQRHTGIPETDLWNYENQKEIWSEFLNHYTTLIIDDEATFYQEHSVQLELDVYARCKYLLDKIKMYCPQYYIDGNTNTWIIKPISNCSGHGIILSRDLNKIKEKINFQRSSSINYILQKYIERPLLVYNCKIDLRLWFLVTNMNPIVVWIYKEGYVRFCANHFSMKNMYESVHLSNVRLQMKYRRSRNLNVPEECMWDYKELQNHLVSIGEKYVWDELIFPGMSESIYNVLQASTDASFYRPKSFHLFGADFVITQNYIPYLIEINSIPGLNPSTSIIANLVPILLEDIVKVVVDYEEDSNADTGLFVKVVPENMKTTSDKSEEISQSAGITPIIQPKLSNIPSIKAYPQNWFNINDKLANEVQCQISAKISNDCYLGYNRDYLLKMAKIPSDTNYMSATREAILNDKVSSAREKVAKLKMMYGPKIYITDQNGSSNKPFAPINIYINKD